MELVYAFYGFSTLIYPSKLLGLGVHLRNALQNSPTLGAISILILAIILVYLSNSYGIKYNYSSLFSIDFFIHFCKSVSIEQLITIVSIVATGTIFICFFIMGMRNLENKWISVLFGKGMTIFSSIIMGIGILMRYRVRTIFELSDIINPYFFIASGFIGIFTYWLTMFLSKKPFKWKEGIIVFIFCSTWAALIFLFMNSEGGMLVNKCFFWILSSLGIDIIILEFFINKNKSDLLMTLANTYNSKRADGNITNISDANVNSKYINPDNPNPISVNPESFRSDFNSQNNENKTKVGITKVTHDAGIKSGLIFTILNDNIFKPFMKLFKPYPNPYPCYTKEIDTIFSKLLGKGGKTYIRWGIHPRIVVPISDKDIAALQEKRLYPHGRGKILGEVDEDNNTESSQSLALTKYVPNRPNSYSENNESSIVLYNKNTNTFKWCIASPSESSEISLLSDFLGPLSPVVDGFFDWARNQPTPTINWDMAVLSVNNNYSDNFSNYQLPISENNIIYQTQPFLNQLKLRIESFSCNNHSLPLYRRNIINQVQISLNYILEKINIRQNMLTSQISNYDSDLHETFEVVGNNIFFRIFYKNVLMQTAHITKDFFSSVDHRQGISHKLTSDYLITNYYFGDNFADEQKNYATIFTDFTKNYNNFQDITLYTPQTNSLNEMNYADNMVMPQEFAPVDSTEEPEIPVIRKPTSVYLNTNQLNDLLTTQVGPSFVSVISSLPPIIPLSSDISSANLNQENSRQAVETDTSENVFFDNDTEEVEGVFTLQGGETSNKRGKRPINVDSEQGIVRRSKRRILTQEYETSQNETVSNETNFNELAFRNSHNLTEDDIVIPNENVITVISKWHIHPHPYTRARDDFIKKFENNIKPKIEELVKMPGIILGEQLARQKYEEGFRLSLMVKPITNNVGKVTQELVAESWIRNLSKRSVKSFVEVEKIYETTYTVNYNTGTLPTHFSETFYNKKRKFMINAGPNTGLDSIYITKNNCKWLTQDIHIKNHKRIFFVKIVRYEHAGLTGNGFVHQYYTRYNKRSYDEGIFQFSIDKTGILETENTNVTPEYEICAMPKNKFYRLDDVLLGFSWGNLKNINTIVSKLRNLPPIVSTPEDITPPLVKLADINETLCETDISFKESAEKYDGLRERFMITKCALDRLDKFKTLGFKAGVKSRYTMVVNNLNQATTEFKHQERSIQQKYPGVNFPE